MVEDIAGGPGWGEDTELPAAETVIRLLANQRRRFALSCLLEYENAMTLADLADEVTIKEQDCSIEAISAEEVKRTYMSLYHTHVPKLEEAGFARYDQEQDMVALGSNPETIELYVEHVNKVLSDP